MEEGLGSIVGIVLKNPPYRELSKEERFRKLVKNTNIIKGKGVGKTARRGHRLKEPFGKPSFQARTSQGPDLWGSRLPWSRFRGFFLLSTHYSNSTELSLLLLLLNIV